jgi:hypothetical protein
MSFYGVLAAAAVVADMNRILCKLILFKMEMAGVEEVVVSVLAFILKNQ